MANYLLECKQHFVRSSLPAEWVHFSQEADKKAQKTMRSCSSKLFEDLICFVSQSIDKASSDKKKEEKTNHPSHLQPCGNF